MIPSATRSGIHGFPLEARGNDMGELRGAVMSSIKPEKTNPGNGVSFVWGSKPRGILSFFLIALVLIFAGFYFYMTEAEQVLRVKASELSSIGKMKVDQILRWHKERSDDAVRLADSVMIEKSVGEWLRDPDRLLHKEDLIERLRLEQDLGVYFQALLVSPDQKILLSATSSPAEMETDSWAAVKKALTEPEPVFSQLHYTPSGKVHVDIAKAIRDDAGQVMAVLVLTTNANEFLFPMIRVWPTSSPSGESILVRRQGDEVLFMNMLRHREDTALRMHLPISRPLFPAAQAVQGRTGIVFGVDYSGTKVVADLRPIPDTDWFLETKQNESEVEGEVRLRALVAFVVVLLLVLGIAGGMAIRYQSWQIKESKKMEAATALSAHRTQALLKLNQMTEASLKEITDFALEEAVRLTQSKIGYLAFLNEDESVLTMHSWSKSAMAECAISQKPIVYPVETTGLWGEAVRQRRAVITNNYAAANPLKKGCPKGHVAVKRHMNTPVFDGSRIVIVAGVGNKEEEYNQSDVEQLTLLMEGMWRLLERKRLEEELVKSKEMQFKTLIETLPSKVFLKDKNSVYISCNESFASDLGIKVKEIIGKTDYDLFPTPLAEKRREEDKRIMESGKAESREEEYHLINDYLKGSQTSYVDIVKAPVRDNEGNVTGILGIFWDITERKEAENALRRNRELLFEMTSQVPGVVYQFYARPNGERGLYFVSPKAEQIFGLKSDQEDFFEKFTALVAPENREDFLNSIEKSVREVSEWKFEGMIEKPSGEKIWFSGNSIPFLGKNEIIFNGILLDITEWKKAEVEKKRVEVLASTAETKSRFASMVSHELRSPMAVIKEALDIVLEGMVGSINDEQKNVLDMAKTNITRLGRLINNVLDFQKVESGKMEFDIQENDLKEVMREVHESMSVLAKRAGLNLAMELDEGLPILKFDRDRIIQVLTNLVSNAVKNTEKGGVTIAAKKEADVVHLSVQDAGRGIPAQDIGKLFHAFEQVDSLRSKPKGGTGLGLAISKEIVLAHHGKIWAESEVGKGSTFHVTLPL